MLGMKNLSRSGRLNYVFSIISYILFGFLTVSIIIFGTNTIQKWIISVVFVLFLIGGIFVEYLKRKYHKALYALNFELNTKKAIALFDELEKKDLFHGYQNTRILFDVQVALEEKRYSDALRLIDQNEDIFRKDLEMFSIMQYVKLRCYVAKGDQKRAARAYKDFKMTSKQKRAPRIFSPDEVEGLYQLAIKNKNSAYKCFKAVNMKNMNTREIAFILTQLKELTPYKDEREEYQEALENIEKMRTEGEEE